MFCLFLRSFLFPISFIYLFGNKPKLISLHFYKQKYKVQLQFLPVKMQYTKYKLAIRAIGAKRKKSRQSGDLHGIRTRNLHLERVATSPIRRAGHVAAD